MVGEHPELRALCDADQADRAGWSDGAVPLDWGAVALRDAERLERVKQLVAENAPQTERDFWHAALVCQHGPTIEDIELANTLARRAVALDPAYEEARWLVAASEDRVLVRRGERQRWGTQFHIDDDGRWSVEPYDESVTDEERAAWGVPPIAEAHERVRRHNENR